MTPEKQRTNKAQSPAIGICAELRVPITGAREKPDLKRLENGGSGFWGGSQWPDVTRL
jgi:hypothetical protein